MCPPHFFQAKGVRVYRLVASDMDETFLDSNHAIPPANLRALRRMRELGVLFVPSSGRWYSSIMDNFPGEARELLEGSYVLSYNGGFINRVGDPEPLTTCGLSRACAEELYARGRELGLAMHINVADGHVFVPDADDDERAYLASISGVTHVNSKDHPDLSFLEGRDIVKILYVNRDFDALQELGASLAPVAERLGVEITFSSKRYLEFMPAGVNKGTGLARLAEMLEDPPIRGHRGGRLGQRPFDDPSCGAGRGRGQRHGRCAPLLRRGARHDRHGRRIRGARRAVLGTLSPFAPLPIWGL